MLLGGPVRRRFLLMNASIAFAHPSAICKTTETFHSSRRRFIGWHDFWKTCRISRTRQGTVTLFSWQGTLPTPQCHQWAHVVFLGRTLAGRKRTTALTLPLLVCVRLFVGSCLILFTANQLSGGPFLIRNLGTRPIACSSVLIMDQVAY